MAAARLLFKEKKLPNRAARNARIAETPMFARFKYDQSMDAFRLRLTIVEEEALRGSLVAARSSSIDERANDGSFSARSNSWQVSSPTMWYRQLHATTWSLNSL